MSYSSFRAANALGGIIKTVARYNYKPSTSLVFKLSDWNDITGHIITKFANEDDPCVDLLIGSKVTKSGKMLIELSREDLRVSLIC